MNEYYDIRYLRRKEIDILKWDRCIDGASNRLIYALSFYLDHMTEGQWDALVLNDYELIMPLPWRKKWGITYLYQPPFTQQLGIFGAFLPIPQPRIDEFLSRAFGLFRFAEIFLNYGNPHPSMRQHKNFILDLAVPYEQLVTNYKKDLLRNLKLAGRRLLDYTEDIELSTSLQLFKGQYKEKIGSMGDRAYEQFEKLCNHLLPLGQVVLRGVRGEDGDLFATALFLRNKGRLHLLQSTNLPAGRQAEANHFLLDRVIREFAGQPITLDFEGSDIPGIAYFYKSFGSIDQPYFFYRLNRLPWPLRLFK
jgi:hypothetical protein